MKVNNFIKILIIPLSLLTISTIGLGLYYLYSDRQEPQNWKKIEKTIMSTCKEIDLSDSQDYIDYITKLYALINKRAVKQEGQQVIYGETITKQNSQTNSDTIKCWVVFVGSKSGNGNTIFETEEGTFKELLVTDFPH